VRGYLTVLKLLGNDIGHRPLLMLGVLLVVVGVQVLATGLIAELIVHLATPQAPYVLRRILKSTRGADVTRPVVTSEVAVSPELAS
jgi:hypothetical protein